MALADMAQLDVWFLIADAMILSIISLMYYYKGNTFAKCRRIEINDYQLKVWRFFLYATIFTSWVIAYLIFANPNLIRHILHLFFIIGVSQMLEISIPAFVCKKMGFGGTCNCDFYQYNDFKPMIALGTIGNIVFTFTPINETTGLLLLVLLVTISLAIYYLIPKKKLEPLKYPPELLISEIDQLQEFLMSNPQERKLLTILDASCDFCEIQVEEILRLSDDLLEKLRIYDLTFAEELDPIIPMTLNMNSMDTIPVPTTFIFDSGMCIEQKDGVLSKSEIESILF